MERGWFFRLIEAQDTQQVPEDQILEQLISDGGSKMSRIELFELVWSKSVELTFASPWLAAGYPTLTYVSRTPLPCNSSRRANEWQSRTLWGHGSIVLHAHARAIPSRGFRQAGEKRAEVRETREKGPEIERWRSGSRRAAAMFR